MLQYLDRTAIWFPSPELFYREWHRPRTELVAGGVFYTIERNGLYSLTGVGYRQHKLLYQPIALSRDLRVLCVDGGVYSPIGQLLERMVADLGLYL